MILHLRCISVSLVPFILLIYITSSVLCSRILVDFSRPSANKPYHLYFKYDIANRIQCNTRDYACEEKQFEGTTITCDPNLKCPPAWKCEAFTYNLGDAYVSIDVNHCTRCRPGEYSDDGLTCKTCNAQNVLVGSVVLWTAMYRTVPTYQLVFGGTILFSIYECKPRCTGTSFYGIGPVDKDVNMYKKTYRFHSSCKDDVGRTWAARRIALACEYTVFCDEDEILPTPGYLGNFDADELSLPSHVGENLEQCSSEEAKSNFAHYTSIGQCTDLCPARRNNYGNSIGQSRITVSWQAAPPCSFDCDVLRLKYTVTLRIYNDYVYTASAPCVWCTNGKYRDTQTDTCKNCPPNYYSNIVNADVALCEACDLRHETSYIAAGLEKGWYSLSTNGGLECVQIQPRRCRFVPANNNYYGLHSIPHDIHGCMCLFGEKVVYRNYVLPQHEQIKRLDELRADVVFSHDSKSFTYSLETTQLLENLQPLQLEPGFVIYKSADGNILIFWRTCVLCEDNEYIHQNDYQHTMHTQSSCLPSSLCTTESGETVVAREQVSEEYTNATFFVYEDEDIDLSSTGIIKAESENYLLLLDAAVDIQTEPIYRNRCLDCRFKKIDTSTNIISPCDSHEKGSFDFCGCTECEPHYHCIGVTCAACSPCPPNTQRPAHQTQCQACPEFTYSFAGQACVENICEPGHYRRDSDCVKCEACPYNYYRTGCSAEQEGQLGECTPCPACDEGSVRINCMHKAGHNDASGSCQAKNLLVNNAFCPTQDQVVVQFDETDSNFELVQGLGGFTYKELFGKQAADVDFQCQDLCNGYTPGKNETTNEIDSEAIGTLDSNTCSGPYACGVQRCSMAVSLDRIDKACPVMLPESLPESSTVVSRYIMEACVKCNECGITENTKGFDDWGQGCADECSRIWCDDGMIFDWTDNENEEILDKQKCKTCADLRDTRLCNSSTTFDSKKYKITGNYLKFYMKDCKPKSDETSRIEYGSCTLCSEFETCDNDEYYAGCTASEFFCEKCQERYRQNQEVLQRPRKYSFFNSSYSIIELFCQVPKCENTYQISEYGNICLQSCTEKECGANEIKIPCSSNADTMCISPAQVDSKALMMHTSARFNILNFLEETRDMFSFENALVNAIDTNILDEKVCVYNSGEINDMLRNPGGVSNSFRHRTCSSILTEDSPLMPLQNVFVHDTSELQPRIFINRNSYIVTYNNAEIENSVAQSGYFLLSVHFEQKAQIMFQNLNTISSVDIAWVQQNALGYCIQATILSKEEKNVRVSFTHNQSLYLQRGNLMQEAVVTTTCLKNQNCDDGVKRCSAQILKKFQINSQTTMQLPGYSDELYFSLKETKMVNCPFLIEAQLGSLHNLTLSFLKTPDLQRTIYHTTSSEFIFFLRPQRRIIPITFF